MKVSLTSWILYSLFDGSQRNERRLHFSDSSDVVLSLFVDVGTRLDGPV